MQRLSGPAWPGTRALRVTARTYEDAARTQCSFRLEPVDDAPLPAYRPGQFVSLALALPDTASPGGQRTVTRCYSLSDRPLPTHWRITVKRAPGGLASNHLHDHVQAGDLLQVRAPAGRFFVDTDPIVPMVLLAGGVGITPLMSMLAWSLALQPQRPVHLYHGVRHGGEQAFAHAMRHLAAQHPQFTLHTVCSRPGPEDPAGGTAGAGRRHVGHLDLALLRRTLPAMASAPHRFYVCGPKPMMDTLVPALAASGVSASDIHHEAFAFAPAPRAVGAAAACPAP